MGQLEDKYRKQIAEAEKEYGEFANPDTDILPVTVIENSTDAADEYRQSDKAGGCSNSQLVILTPQQIQALQNGKALAISPQKEYDVFITFET